MTGPYYADGDVTPPQDAMASWRSEWGDDADYAIPQQGIDRAANASPIELRMLGNTKEGHQ